MPSKLLEILEEELDEEDLKKLPKWLLEFREAYRRRRAELRMT